MFEGIYTAAAGMAVQQRATDALANDIANLDTPGYKTVRMHFRDLLYGPPGPGGGAGAGAAANVAGRSSAQGTLYDTGRSLDVGIEGQGFFEVRRPGGTVALTRDGSFQLDASGRLITADGNLVLPGVALPPRTAAADVQIAADGTVTAAGAPVGQIRVVTVPSPDGLRPLGNSLFQPTAASGRPGAARATALHQGQLEASTADPIELVAGQRSFQLLSRVIATQDQMLGVANNLKQ